MSFDVVIAGGTVVDGSGAPRYAGDVGIVGDRIVEIGALRGRPRRRTVDAAGLVVAPGFIDPHTHLDPQLSWDPTASPSLHHGVTTVVTGNCSLSMAPCKAADREALSRMFYRIEDIPLEVLTNGVDWTWETFGEWADSLRGALAVNVAGLVGHSTLRYHVMGPGAWDRQATAAEVSAMSGVLRRCLIDGALGLSTSRLVQHVGDGGRAIPSRVATDDELMSLAAVMGELGSGLLQTDPGETTRSTPSFIRDVLMPIAEDTGCPVLLSGTVQERGAPLLWREVHDLIADAQERGLRMHTQATPCRIDGRFTLRGTLQFNDMDTWRTVLSLPHADKCAALRDPTIRDAMQFEAVDDDRPVFFSRQWDTVSVLEVTDPGNAHLIGSTIQAMADDGGRRVIDVLLDLALSEDLDVAFLAYGRANGDDEAVAAQLLSPQAIVGSSDAGAHVTQLCGAGDTSLLLSRWVRELGVLTLEEGVRAITAKPAAVLGLRERGLLRSGCAADVVVFDADSIDYAPTRMVDDLPGGGQRLWRDGVGVHLVMVNGQVVLEGQEPTGARSGRVLRRADLDQFGQT